MQREQAMVCAAVEWVRALNVSNLLRLAFLFPCSWYLELNYYLFKSKTNKQTNKQTAGGFFSSQLGFFPPLLATLQGDARH